MRAPQAWKTALFLGARDLYVTLARIDLAALAASAERVGARAAMRFDGASDTGVASDPRLRADAERLGVVFWDYTKSIDRARAALSDPLWDVTLSYPGGDPATDAEAWAPFAEHVAEGGRVAVVVDVPKGAPLPTMWRGLPAINGDLSDLRFRDPRGVVVLLRPKGSKRNTATAARLQFAVAVGAA